MLVKLGGVCAYKGFLDGLTFVSEGLTASGAPYFKAIGAEQYIYHDADCGGAGNSTARWVIDSDAPNASVLTDLDQDGACNYHARIESDLADVPPSEGNWSVFCGEAWESHELTLEVVDADVTQNESLSSGFKLAGEFCGGKEIFEGLVFDLAGATRGGAPFFASREHGKYMYYDPSCSGARNGKARWVIDDDAPDTETKRDLDGDGACDYHARADSDDAKSPPEAAMWHFLCDDGTWKDTLITLETMPPPEATPHDEGEHGNATAQGSGADGQVDGAHSGLQWHVVAIVLSIFGLMYHLGA